MAYPFCRVREDDLPPGTILWLWNNPKRERVERDWIPQNVLRADYLPEADRAIENPDISFASGGAPYLTARARDLIELLEPGAHQFFPVDIYDPNGNVREPRRYILNVCQCVDAIVDGIFSLRKDGTRFYTINPRHPVTIQKDIVLSLHLWRDRKADASQFFVSDRLYEGIMAAGYGEFSVVAIEET